MDGLTADGNADINGNADVSGTLDAGASTLASATITGAATVTGHTELDGGLNVDGATTMDGLTADGNADINGNADVSGTLDAGASTLASATITGTATVTGHTELDGGLNVDGATTMDGLTADGNADINGNADVSGTLNVDGATTMAALTADGAADLQAGLNVDGATTMDATTMAGNLTQTGDHLLTGNSDISGTLDVDDFTQLDGVNSDGDLSVNTDKFTVAAATGNTAIAGTTTSEGLLTVNDNSDLNGTLDVEDETSLNTGGNAGTVFSIYNSQGAAAITVNTSDDALAIGGSATTLTTPRLIVQEDANYNGDMTVSGSLSVTDNIISAAAPTSPNHMANKQYVDNAVLNAVYAPEAYSYDAIESVHPSDVIYYINGDLLLYATGQTDNYNYVIELTGSKLNDTDVTGAKLYARGNDLDLFTSPTTDWQWGSGDSDASFKVGYNHISALAGAQIDGYVSCSLVLFDAAGNGHNTGLTLRFYLDSANPVADGDTFSE